MKSIHSVTRFRLWDVALIEVCHWALRLENTRSFQGSLFLPLLLGGARGVALGMMKGLSYIIKQFHLYIDLILLSWHKNETVTDTLAYKQSVIQHGIS